jgi:hypothetical protein
VCQNAETRQAVGESAGDSVRNSEIEGCNPPFAESDQEDGGQQDCQKRDDRCGDDYGCRKTLLQLRVLRFGLLQDGDVPDRRVSRGWAFPKKAPARGLILLPRPKNTIHERHTPLPDSGFVIVQRSWAVKPRRRVQQLKESYVALNFFKTSRRSL